MNAPLPILDTKQSAGPALKLDPRTYDRALSCVHCGLCLPACPTYTTTYLESDSPRGRIQLMRAMADGVIDPTDSVRKHLDLCLGCRGCESACPSAVVYHELIEETRTRFAEQEASDGQSRVMRWIFFHVLPHPGRLRLAMLPARVMQKIGLYGLLRRLGIFRLLPAPLKKMEQMLPAEGRVWPRALPERMVGDGATKRVGFFAGCVGSVIYDRVNLQAMELLSAAGAEVVAPREQSCCGAIHHHNGAHASAQDLARRNIDVFLPVNGPAVDFIATNIAGCGAMLREYDVLLRDDASYCARAKEFVKRVRDISEVLLELGLPQMRYEVRETVTYHDACHLAHAQKVTAPPRQILSKIPGLKVVPLADSDMCCGAAGTYNLTQPEMATQLAGRKLANIAATGASICVAGNVGCAMHIQSEAESRGQKLTVKHPVELLHEAVFGPGW